jgi:hypothetical protein
MVMKMTKQFILSLVLCVTFVAATGVDSVFAAPCDVALEAAEPCEEAGAFEEEDVLAVFLQWLDRILDSAAAGHTSAISIWNH